MSIYKKRTREEEDWDDEFQEKLSNTIPRVVTYPEDDEDDDDFVSSLLGEATAAIAHFSHRDASEEAPWQHSSAKVDSNACTPAACIEDAAACDPRRFQTGVEMPDPHPSAMHLEHETPELDLKMPAAKSPTQHAALPTQFDILAPLASTIRNAERVSKPPPPTMFVERWTCDVCKSCTFETFDEAQAHEIQCQIIHDSKKKPDEQIKTQMSEVANVLTSLAFCPLQKQDNIEGGGDCKIRPKRHPSINLVPQDFCVLSDYNNLLVRHIEFYYPSSDNRVGLRCIHCKDHPQHVTAATFFPSTIGSISSGLGTIGARHFGWGKCPFVQPEIVQQMIETKKTSNLQTRTNGRVGLDAYCKKLAKYSGIIDDENSGICWVEGAEPNLDLVDDDIAQSKTSTSSHESTRSSSDQSSATDFNAIASVLASMKGSEIGPFSIPCHIGRHRDSAPCNVNNSSLDIETRTFIPSETQYFWECYGCRSIPFDYRAKGSVVHSVGEPPREKTEGHLKSCTGGKPLAIPRSAIIEPYYCEGVPTIKVKWVSEHATRLSGTSRRSLNVVQAGVEDGRLCFQEDQQYTTELAFFTVMQLKKCYLTKAGGSRGTCPIGFAGLACTHCAGESIHCAFRSNIHKPITYCVFSATREPNRAKILLHLR